ncbi:MAG: DUF1232 domain-containing protein [Geminicoccaceae bacterium]|nr:DUF1232 domain-containing protein [Geminicoccaceae bacterium]
MVPENLPMVMDQPDERRFWAKLARTLSRLPFAEDLAAAWYCARDPDTPAYVRGLLFGAVAYFILPTDMIPDVILGLGFTDDASVLTAVIVAVGRNIRPEHRRRARLKLDELQD